MTSLTNRKNALEVFEKDIRVAKKRVDNLRMEWRKTKAAYVISAFVIPFFNHNPCVDSATLNFKVNEYPVDETTTDRIVESSVTFGFAEKKMFQHRFWPFGAHIDTKCLVDLAELVPCKIQIPVYNANEVYRKHAGCMEIYQTLDLESNKAIRFDRVTMLKILDVINGTDNVDDIWELYCSMLPNIVDF
ncbi:MAG: hypothetical protein ACYCS8_01860 [Acidithiobacillus sp.]